MEIGILALHFFIQHSFSSATKITLIAQSPVFPSPSSSTSGSKSVKYDSSGKFTLLFLFANNTDMIRYKEV